MALKTLKTGGPSPDVRGFWIRYHRRVLTFEWRKKMTNLAHALNASERYLRHRPGVVSRLARLIIAALRIRRERRMMAALTTEQLDDLGLSRSQAEAESRRGYLDISRQRKNGLDL